jgi:hypothetical protein
MTVALTEGRHDHWGMVFGALVLSYAVSLVAFVFVGPVVLMAMMDVTAVVAFQRVIVIDAVGYLLLAVVVLR